MSQTVNSTKGFTLSSHWVVSFGVKSETNWCSHPMVLKIGHQDLHVWSQSPSQPCCPAGRHVGYYWWGGAFVGGTLVRGLWGGVDSLGSCLGGDIQRGSQTINNKAPVKTKILQSFPHPPTQPPISSQPPQGSPLACFPCFQTECRGVVFRVTLFAFKHKTRALCQRRGRACINSMRSMHSCFGGW